MTRALPQMSSACPIAIVLDPQEWRVIRIALFFAADSDIGRIRLEQPDRGCPRIYVPGVLEWVIINETWYNPAAFAKRPLHLPKSHMTRGRRRSRVSGKSAQRSSAG